MSPYMVINEEDNLNNYGVAAAIHSGGTIQGHYYAMSKNANGKWYIFNDTNVIEFKGDMTNLRMRYVNHLVASIGKSKEKITKQYISYESEY